MGTVISCIFINPYESVFHNGHKSLSQCCVQECEQPVHGCLRHKIPESERKRRSLTRRFTYVMHLNATLTAVCCCRYSGDTEKEFLGAFLRSICVQMHTQVESGGLMLVNTKNAYIIASFYKRCCSKGVDKRLFIIRKLR